ncbi:hypothetical protein D3C71_1312200 [compost metagenome]
MLWGVSLLYGLRVQSVKQMIILRRTISMSMKVNSKKNVVSEIPLPKAKLSVLAVHGLVSVVLRVSPIPTVKISTVYLGIAMNMRAVIRMMIICTVTAAIIMDIPMNMITQDTTMHMTNMRQGLGLI